MQTDDSQHNEFGLEINDKDNVEGVNDKDDVVEVDKNHEEVGADSAEFVWMNKWKQTMMMEICEADSTYYEIGQ